MLCPFTTRTIPTLPSETPTGQHGAFFRLISSSVQVPMLRLADRYVRNCAIAILPLLPVGVPWAIFAGIASRMPFAPIHPSAMLLIMATGRAQQLITLFKQLPILPEKEIIEIITAQNSVGTPALFLAMMNGHTDNVKIFMQEIQSLVDNHIIHEDNLVKLLQTKSANETHGLYISMLYGFDEIIDIFLNALTTPIAQELLNKKLVMSILAMKIHDGEPDYTPQWKIITLCVSHGSSLKLMASPLNTS